MEFNYQKYVHDGLVAREKLGKPMDIDSIAVEMVGELGEMFNAYKHARKWPDAPPEEEEHLFEEFGDLMWYMVALCDLLGYNMCDVVAANMEKLDRRYGNG